MVYSRPRGRLSLFSPQKRYNLYNFQISEEMQDSYIAMINERLGRLSI